MRPHARRRAPLVLAALAALGALGACDRRPPHTGPVPAGRHVVLFIGNSLTYANDLPGTLAGIAREGGDTIHVASVAEGGTALIDHTGAYGPAMGAIRRGGWEYVVLQQGPTWPGICLDTLLLAARTFAGPIRAAGARPALYMVWPSREDLPHFDGVRESYVAAARAVDGVLLPAGEAWREAWDADPSLPLYGADGFHPSPLGTYLAALVMYERITGRDARTLPPRATVAGRTLAAPEATVRLLQRAAHAANARLQR